MKIKKIISSITGASILCGSIFAPLTVNAVHPEISLGSIIYEQQLHHGTDVESPDLLPINDCIKDLDESIITIMIDPGHFSQYNRSPVYSPYWESEMTWKLSNYLQKELQALGVHADLTKSSLDEDPTLNDRGFCSKGYDFFISMHSNADDNRSLDQPIALVYQDLPWTTIDDISQELGKLLAVKVSDVMGTNQKGLTMQRKGTSDWDRNGVMDDEWYSVLFGSRYVGTPGILLEHSFHTNYRSTLWLYNDDNLKKLAKEEANVIFDYFSKIKPPPTPTITAQPILDAVYGDIDGDGKIGASDAAAVLGEYAALSSGNPSFTAEQFAFADIDSDGKITADDASNILMFYSYLSAVGTEKDPEVRLKNIDP